MLLESTFYELLEAIKPQKLIEDRCRFDSGVLTVGEASYDLNTYNKIYLLGSGKAVVPMATAMEKLLQGSVDVELFVGAYPLEEQSLKGRYLESSHPIPTSKSLVAGEQMLQTLAQMREDDFFIYLLSGGNSALMELPEAGLDLQMFDAMTSLMLEGGMPIEAINAVRKKLSRVKGGKLASASKAQGIVLVLSDVIDDNFSVIGSGPFYPDDTTLMQAVELLKTYAIWEKMPEPVRRFLQSCSESESESKPREIPHYLLGSNSIVLHKACEILQSKGVATTLVKESYSGDVRTVCDRLVRLGSVPQSQHHCFIMGGEATVHVTGHGKGGRNQHLVLEMMERFKEKNGFTLLSAATDGIDGNSSAAGAMIDEHSLMTARELSLNPYYFQEVFDSNAFFEQTGELIEPGPTHNNLLDIVMLLIEPHHNQGEDDG